MTRLPHHQPGATGSASLVTGSEPWFDGIADGPPIDESTGDMTVARSGDGSRTHEIAGRMFRAVAP